MTQQSLILQFIKDNGSAIPAKLIGKPYAGGFFGAELSRVCRELRKQGILTSRREGKFQRFFLTHRETKYMNVLGDNGEILKVIKVEV